MSSILTAKFSTVNALNFKEFISGMFANTYVSFGKQTKWDDTDSIIPAATDTANTFYNCWDNMIGMKKVTGADMCLVIPRIDWTTGVVYDEFGPDVSLYAKSSVYNINFDKTFYARNNKDQVFKCLFNNFGTASTVMPEITIGGQLPENAFIETGDGYKWKYMYTIPAGIKEKFFTSKYMPIYSDPIVYNTATDGRIDIIKIVSPGAGYNSNTNSNNLAILSVAGNGANANISLKVSSTAPNGANIVGYNVMNGGNGYTRATLTINDPIKIAYTANAVLVPVIGPPGGHGSNVAFELGATNLMITVEINSDENGVFPLYATDVLNSPETIPSQFRQIALVKDPKYSSNGSYIGLETIRTTTKYYISPPIGHFKNGETIYIGNSLDSAVMTASVEYYDDSVFHLYVNNIVGGYPGITPSIRGCESGASATILQVEEPLVRKYSGDLLYIDNTSVVTRAQTETQQIKLTLRY